MDTDRDFDIAFLEIQLANDKLIEQWLIQKEGKRRPEREDVVSAQEQLNASR